MNPTVFAWSNGWWEWIRASSWQIALLVVLVGVLAMAARRLPGRFRYFLWGLVLVKVFLPPSLGVLWGVGAWGIDPVMRQVTDRGAAVATWEIPAAFPSEEPGITATFRNRPSSESQEGEAAAVSFVRPSWATTFLAIWIAGVAVFLANVFWRYFQLVRSLKGSVSVEEGPLRIEVERIALQLGRRNPPVMLLAPMIRSPFLYGLFRPHIVVPTQLIESLSPGELRNILVHEMTHWKNRDILVGWLQVIVQALFWFHPFVWFANAQLRHERETACDEEAIALGKLEPKGYAESLLKTLMAARARPSVALAFPGVFERHTKLQERLEGIMNSETRKSRLSPWSWGILVLFAIVALPMAPVAQQPEDAASKEITYRVVIAPKAAYRSTLNAPDLLLDAFNRNLPEGVKPRYSRFQVDEPGMVSGRIYVDGDKDRDAVVEMLRQSTQLELIELVPATPGEWKSQEKAALTSETQPEASPSEGVTWIVTFRPVAPFHPADSRELLEAFNELHPEKVRTHHFRFEQNGDEWVGRICVDGNAGLDAINAMFSKSEKLAFVDSELATGEAMSRHLGIEPSDQATPSGPPRIVSTTPAIGARDVDPSLSEITITFDRDMASGFSWTGGPPAFPPPGDGGAYWRDSKTCILPVSLEAGKYYRVGINSKSHRNFRSTEGIPVLPSAIYFTTKGADAETLLRLETPRVVHMDPANGATDVDPSMQEIRITFSVPMGGGFSWTGGGPTFPKIPEGKRPYWTRGGLMCVLPVELTPGTTYHIGLNSPSHRNFQSEGGIPLEPVPYTFTTRSE